LLFRYFQEYAVLERHWMKTHSMAGHLIRRLHQISTQVFAKRVQDANFDITPVQFAAMDAIITQPGIDQAGVAALIAYDRATIGGVIDRLEQKGYVARTICKHDRRAREVTATKKGKEVFGQILPTVISLQEEILPGLDETERARFLELATKAIRSISEQSPAG
jgi:DNA-binding MarR family transcriptional regulator